MDKTTTSDMQGIDVRKRELRRHFRGIRKAIPPEERESIDAAICRRVVALPEFREAQALLPYLSFGAEVETRGVIRAAWSAGKVVALPWCVPGTREMRWYRIESFDDLVRSSLGVKEPVPDPTNELKLGGRAIMLSLVPGLTFDLKGYRMGYGGGFYDTFLAGFDGVSVGLCREAQLSPGGVEVLDVHDRPVDVVVTESRTVREL